jgi:hypothetical protein
VVRLQRDLFEGASAWPLILVACGLGMMAAAAHYAALRMALARLLAARRPRP